MLSTRTFTLATISFSLFAGLLVAGSDGQINYSVPPTKEPFEAEFSRYLPAFKPWDASAPVIPGKAEHVRSKFGTRDFVLIQLTDSKTPYEDTRAVIAIFEDGKPASYLRIKGFKNLNVEWVTEDVLKVDTWPGRSLQIVELLDITNGLVLYTGAWSHIHT
jgi:hypothetical protein